MSFTSFKTYFARATHHARNMFQRNRASFSSFHSQFFSLGRKTKNKIMKQAASPSPLKTIGSRPVNECNGKCPLRFSSPIHVEMQNEHNKVPTFFTHQRSCFLLTFFPFYFQYQFAGTQYDESTGTVRVVEILVSGNCDKEGVMVDFLEECLESKEVVTFQLDLRADGKTCDCENPKFPAVWSKKQVGSESIAFMNIEVPTNNNS